MLKKFLWISMLVLITACTVYVSNGGVITGDGTPTVTQTGVAATTAVVTTQASTATNTPEPTATQIPATATTAPTLTPTATATNTPTATATATAIPMAYKVQTGSPAYMVNFAHSSASCAWEGIAGQVFNSAGTPVTNYVVKVTGSYNGSPVSILGVTGMVSGNPYGPGSYEIVLGSTPVDSTDLLTIQVFNSTGQALTDPIKFGTSSNCSKNLIIINFVSN